MIPLSLSVTSHGLLNGNVTVKVKEKMIGWTNGKWLVNFVQRLLMLFKCYLNVSRCSLGLLETGFAENNTIKHFWWASLRFGVVATGHCCAGAVIFQR